jgi:hypothetical protein
VGRLKALLAMSNAAPSPQPSTIPPGLCCRLPP